MKKKPVKDLDYVKLYSEKLKENNSLFKQQKILIESQLEGSRSIFKNMFFKNNFKENARKYLKDIGLLK